MSDHPGEHEPPIRTITNCYFRLTAEPVVRTFEVKPARLMVDLDAEGRAVGIEVLGDVFTMGHAVDVIRAAEFGSNQQVQS